MLSATRSSRVFSTSAAFQAAAVARKSFNKSNTYDKSKNRKGAGNDKSWKDSVLKNNYARKAQDAPLVEMLTDFSPAQAFKITKYPAAVNQKLHIAGAFNPHQYNELYSQPLTMVRPREDAFVAKFHESSLASSSLNNRLVITGEKGVGKSTLLAHLQAQVLASEAVLIPFAYADALVDGSSDFKLNPVSNTYDQNMYARSLLKKIANLNKATLGSINLSKDYNILNKNYKPSHAKLTPENSLLDLATAVAGGADVNATETLRILLDELQLQSAAPVYITVDNFTAFLQHGMTKYRNTSNLPIYFQEFTIANLILAFASGERAFNTGAVVVATHGNHKWKSNETIAVALGDSNPDDLAYAKFSKFDRKLANRLLQNGGLQKLEVSKFDIQETKTMVKHLWDFNLIHNEFNAEAEMAALGNEYFDKLSYRKYLVSGNGNGKLLLDSCVLAYA